MSVRVYPTGPRIYLDMDGVVADFERAMLETNKSANDLKLTPGTYVNLHPFPGALEGVQELLDHGNHVFLLSKAPSKNPYAVAEKLIWTHRHFPSLKDHVIVTPDKGCVGTTQDFLVDDHLEWANAHNFPGTTIQFGGSLISVKLGGWIATTWEDLTLFFRSASRQGKLQ